MSTLNVDILLVVASFCDQSTLCMLIGTCKTLYRTAVRYALNERAVVLRSDRQIERFLRFMRPQNGQRWQLLRELEIDTDLLERPFIAKALASAIRKATHLENLKLAPAEVILGSHPDLGPAFASLPSVKHVEIIGVSGLTCQMLEDMRWPLETAIIERISIHHLWKDDVDDYNAINPVEMLRNARRTLGSLSLDTWLGWGLRSPDIPVYPNMKSLAVMHGHCPPTGPWATAFPNLEHLKIYTLEHGCLDVSDEALEIQLETREENREEHLSRGPWNKLESFKGAALDLYLVGVPCHIRHLKLGVSREELLFLPAALSEARPTTLDLDIYSGMLKGGDNDWMLEHLRDPALNAVRVLNLRLMLHLPCIVDFPDFMDCLMNALSPLPLDSLSFNIELEKISRCVYSSSDTDDTDDTSTERPIRRRRRRATPPPCATEVYMSTLAVDALARRFLQALDSLQSVEVDVEYERGLNIEDKHVRMVKSEICTSASTSASF